MTAARRALRSEIARRIVLLEQAADDAFSLTPVGEVAWDDAPVARLAAGGSALKPRIVPLVSDLLISGEAERLRDRIALWLDAEIGRCFPMRDRILAAPLEGSARGLAFQLTESLIPVERTVLEPLIAGLTHEDRSRLARLGIVVGDHWAFIKGLTKPDAQGMRGAFWRAEHEVSGILPLPRNGRVSMEADCAVDPSYYTAIGYPVAGPRAIRVDMLDRLIGRLRRATVQGVMTPDETIAPVLGCGRPEADAVLLALGWGRHEADGATLYRRQRPAKPPVPFRRRPRRDDAERSPFAVLKQLKTAK
jgi:ATP-dependent RNA helicase SUPV3L1/SUV3